MGGEGTISAGARECRDREGAGGGGRYRSGFIARSVTGPALYLRPLRACSSGAAVCNWTGRGGNSMGAGWPGEFDTRIFAVEPVGRIRHHLLLENFTKVCF